MKNQYFRICIIVLIYHLFMGIISLNRYTDVKICFGEDSRKKDLIETVIVGNEEGISLIKSGQGFAKVIRTRYKEGKPLTTTVWAFFAFKEGKDGMLRWNWQQDYELHADYGIRHGLPLDVWKKKFREARQEGIKPTHSLQPWQRPGSVYRGLFDGKLYATFMDSPCTVNISKQVLVKPFKEYKGDPWKFDPFFYLTYFGQTVGEFLDQIEESNGKIDIIQQGDLYVVSWEDSESKKNRMGGNFTIDSNKAFQIVSSKSWFLVGKERRLFNDDSWQLEEYPNGVWFLKKRIAKLYDRKSGAIDEQTTVEICQAEVNVMIYDRIFTMESMGIPEGAMIVDLRFTPQRKARYHWNRITDMEVVGIIEALKEEEEREKKQ